MELPESLPLGELAAAFATLPVFPLFDTAYFIVSVLYLKYEPGPSSTFRIIEWIGLEKPSEISKSNP
ncbi:hypothetical protein WISP_00746 [Willisornis vidua]|uniref:Uncharacterized protein n=1 Tax=Willisornis vidua TaxID=1566151 RepID=A0ABQ9DV39_9PASS|nr:hypothetical protein WISP_00746 [Willisornis vidua]